MATRLTGFSKSIVLSPIIIGAIAIASYFEGNLLAQVAIYAACFSFVIFILFKSNNNVSTETVSKISDKYNKTESLRVIYFSNSPIEGVQQAFEEMLQQEIVFKQYPLKQAGNIKSDISIYNASECTYQVIGSYFARQTSIYHIEFTYTHLIRG